MKKLFRYGLLLMVVGIGLMFNGQANIDNLKGTYSILPGNMKELSVIHGAIAWQKGVIRRIYDLGHMTDGEPTHKPRADEYKKPDGTADEEAFKAAMGDYVSNYKAWFSKVESPVVKLTRGLFYRVPGTTSVADFKISDLIVKNMTKKEFAAKVAQVMVRLWVYEKLGDLKASVHTITIGGQPFLEGMNFSAGVLSKDIPKNEELVGAKEDALFGNENGGAFRVVLLAALWAYCGYDRALLRVYYDELNNAIKGFIGAINKAGIKQEQKTEILKRLGVGREQAWNPYVISETWENDSFKEQGEYLTTVAGGFSLGDLCYPNVQGAEKYEKLVYVCLISGDRPEDAPYSLGIFAFNGKEYGFADCMDNVFRNLFNHLAYDKEKQAFSVEALKELTKKDVADSVKTFYATWFNAKQITDQAVHDAWTSVIENIPYAIYNRATNSESDGRVGDKRGYVRVPEDCPEAIKAYLHDNKYTIIDDSMVAVYEIMPSMRNFVIALDYLLKLGLFEGKDFAGEYTRADFVKEYLPKAFASFGTVTMPDNIEKYEVAGGFAEFTVNLDKLQESRKQYIITFKITIRSHGEFFSEQLAASSISLFNQIKIAAIEGLSVFLGMLLPADKTTLLCGQPEKPYLLALCAQKLEDLDVVNRIVEGCNQGLNEKQFRLIKYLTEKNPDAAVKAERLLRVYARGISGGANCIDFAIAAAQTGIKAADKNMRVAAMLLFKALVEKGHESASLEAIEAAQEGFKAADRSMRIEALSIFEALFEKGQGLDKAREVLPYISDRETQQQLNDLIARYSK